MYTHSNERRENCSFRLTLEDKNLIRSKVRTDGATTGLGLKFVGTRSGKRELICGKSVCSLERELFDLNHCTCTLHVVNRCRFRRISGTGDPAQRYLR